MTVQAHELRLEVSRFAYAKAVRSGLKCLVISAASDRFNHGCLKALLFGREVAGIDASRSQLLSLLPQRVSLTLELKCCSSKRSFCRIQLSFEAFNRLAGC
ncbi:hypothetical protein [Pseudomonas sp. Marseille-QA0892]